MEKFKTKKAREAYLRDESNWTVKLVQNPIKLLEIKLGSKTYVMIQKATYYKKFNIETMTLEQFDRIDYDRNNKQIFEVDDKGVILEGVSFQNMVEKMVAEGL